MSDEQEEPGEAPERIWDKIAKIKDEALRAYLGKEHPQTAAMILSRIDPALAAKIVASFPAQQRNALLIRMLGIKKVADDAARAVELAIAEDLLAKSSSGSHAGIADILNRLDKTQSDDLLKNLAEVRPDDAKTLKGMMFTFVELVNLPAKARTLLLDQVPIERLVAGAHGNRQCVPGGHPFLARGPLAAHGRSGTARRRVRQRARRGRRQTGDRRYRTEDDGKG